MLEVAVIIVGSLIGTALLFGVVGTLIKCGIHVYKYWCSCLNRRRHGRTSSPPTLEAEAEEVAVLRNPYFLSGEPTVLVIRALPTNYSTLKITCERADGQGHQSTTTTSGDNNHNISSLLPLHTLHRSPAVRLGCLERVSRIVARLLIGCALLEQDTYMATFYRYSTAWLYTLPAAEHIPDC